MTTTIPALDFYLAGVATACLLACTFAARQWIVRHLGRARPLPDLPQRDEASAPEGGVVVTVLPIDNGYWRGTSGQDLRDEHNREACRRLNAALAQEAASLMQGNSEPREWPKHFHDERLPRRAAE